MVCLVLSGWERYLIASDMWMDSVDGLLGAIRILTLYLQTGPQAALPRRHMARATRLLGVHGQDGRWTMNRWDAKRRLEAAGLDPETYEVADEVLWAHAVDYIRATETFKLEDFKRWLETHDEPSSVPARDVPARPHPRARKKVTESTVDQRINKRISDIRT